jgi:hypothetical protein
MNILTDLRAALEAKEEAEANGREVRRHGGDWVAAKYLEDLATRQLHAALTTDTIRALLDAVEAAITLKAAIYAPEVYALDDDLNALDAALAPLVKEADDE